MSEVLQIESLEARNLLTTFYADDSYFIENDQGASGLDAGDTVTFAHNEPGEVTGLIFGTDAFSTIQEAVDASTLNNTVLVGTGTFHENVTIDHGLTLQSTQGRSETTIIGSESYGSELGTIYVAPETEESYDIIYIGDPIANSEVGFTIVGFDSSDPSIEKAAVYIKALQDNQYLGIGIVDSEIVADGEAGFINESLDGINATLRIGLEHNIFSGKTFTGDEPAGSDFEQQYTLANVPRKLIDIRGYTVGASFFKNIITGTSGGFNEFGEQGNTLVSIEATPIGPWPYFTENEFRGSTTGTSSVLQLPHPSYFDNAQNNLFDDAGLTPSVRWLTSALPVDPVNDREFYSFIGNNTFQSRAYAFSAEAVFLTDDLQDAVNNEVTYYLAAKGPFTGDLELHPEDLTFYGGEFHLLGTLNITASDIFLSLEDSTLEGLIFGEDTKTNFVPTEFYSPSSALLVEGIVQIASTAELELAFSPYDPEIGSSFVLVDNDGTDPVEGRFAGLPQGGFFPEVYVGDALLQIDYFGGDGNDIVVTFVGNDSFFIAGADAGGGPHVRILDEEGVEVHSFFAYDPSFTGGVRVATGDVNGDGILDFITAPGAGGGPHVKVFDGSTFELIEGPLGEFYAFDPMFTGGVFVASGDVNGDGFDDVIVSAGAGGGPHVKVYSGADGALLADFFAYDSTFTGGVKVAAGDIDNDGMEEVVTSPGAGGASHVRVFDGTSGDQVTDGVDEFYAYDPSFLGGNYIAVGDVDADGFGDLITGAGEGGGPHIKVFSGKTGAVLHDFYAYDPSFLGGVRVAGFDLNQDGFADILTSAGTGGGPHVKAFDGQTLEELSNLYAFDPSFSGGAFIAGTHSSSPAPMPFLAPFSSELEYEPEGEDSSEYHEESTVYYYHLAYDRAKMEYLEALETFYSKSEEIDKLFSGLGIR
ncbi:Hypothetical protein PBC10988_9790 [Planctomycetales bacterium 10988]|nr:Hypothetical protein PBC10988_9790 [Planctomycetales bacterium 10988]